MDVIIETIEIGKEKYYRDFSATDGVKVFTSKSGASVSIKDAHVSNIRNEYDAPRVYNQISS